MNTFNCWDLLRAKRTTKESVRIDLNVLKIVLIGQSAVKPRLPNPELGRFNDYPEREYTQVGGNGVEPKQPHFTSVEGSMITSAGEFDFRCDRFGLRYSLNLMETLRCYSGTAIPI